MYPEERLAPEHAEESPLHGRIIFILASRESGAGLVLKALGRLPGVAAAPTATNLFSFGFHAMLDTWVASSPGDRLGGLKDLVEEQEFLWGVRRLADGLLGPLAEGTSDDVIVEYSPDHIRSVDAIAALYPDAYLLHVVRDGGEVAGRIASYHRDLYLPLTGQPTPHEHLWRLAAAGADLWCDDQRAAERFSDSPNYLVARIERVLDDPLAFLRWLTERIGLEVDDDALVEAADAIGGGAWQLTAPRVGRAQSRVNILGRDLLEQYDYQPTDVGEARALLGRAEVGYEHFADRARQAMLGLADRLRRASGRWEAEAREPR